MIDYSMVPPFHKVTKTNPCIVPSYPFYKQVLKEAHWWSV